MLSKNCVGDFPGIELIELIINYIKSSLPLRVNPIRLPDLLFTSELEISCRVFLAASGKMTLNFSCDVGSGQIGHLSNLRNLYHKLFEFEIFFGDV